jgi:hypothetical protein
VLEDGLAGLDAGAAFKADDDFRALGARVAHDQPAAEDESDDGHDPDEREAPARTGDGG